MIILQINEITSDVKTIDKNWIAEHISRQESYGKRVTVKVFIEAISINMVLSTYVDPDIEPTTRKVSTEENQIFDWWEKCRLCLNVENLHNFIQQIKHYA
jgi:hypothetical protein